MGTDEMGVSQDVDTPCRRRCHTRRTTTPMLSNMMPGDNSGAEPAEHYRRCRTQCEQADHAYDNDRGIRLLLSAAADLSYWGPGRDDLVRRVMAANEQAFDLLECRWGHRDHECNCDEIYEDEVQQ